MWKLTIEDEDGKQTQLPLARDEYGVGRAESSTVRLTERNISRHHATLRKNGAGWILEDLGSYNGTYINGARVSGEAPVSSGDLIQLGDYRLELVDDDVIDAAVPVSVSAPNRTLPDAGHGPVRPQRLVVVVGPSPGTEFPLVGDYFTLGRAEEATISINHVSISRIHAELVALGNGRFEVVDKGSANGIRINGVELKRGILEAGDALELGDVRLRFVGRGKSLRAGADQSQELPAFAGLEGGALALGAVAGAAPDSEPRRGGGKFVGIGAVVGGLIAIGLLVVALRPTAPAPSASTATSAATVMTEEGTDLVEAARALVAGGDLDGAHKKVGEIPETSALLGGATVREIEAKWATAMFARVDAAADAADKRRLLQEVAASQTVDTVTRKEAANRLAVVSTQAAEPSTNPVVPTGPPPEVVAVAAPSTREPPAAPPSPSPPSASPPSTSPPSTPTTAAPSAAKTAAPSTPAAASEPSSYEKQRRALEPKVWSGKATEGEIRMLKAICAHLGDHACRNRAQAMLKQKQQ